MISMLRRRAEDEKGFTLIELLVVILIIGILAAIAIPSFINQKGKANDAAAESLARTAATAMETYSTGNNGNYTGATAATLNSIEPTLNTVTTNGQAYLAALAPAPTSNTYTVIGVAPSTADRFTITRAATGVSTLTCSPSGKGSCSSTGTW